MLVWDVDERKGVEYDECTRVASGEGDLKAGVLVREAETS
jgi:hypothetical protein